MTEFHVLLHFTIKITKKKQIQTCLWYLYIWHEDIKMALHYFVYTQILFKHTTLCAMLKLHRFMCLPSSLFFYRFNHMCIRFPFWLIVPVSTSMIKMALVALDKIWYCFPTIGSVVYFQKKNSFWSTIFTVERTQ